MAKDKIDLRSLAIIPCKLWLNEKTAHSLPLKVCEDDMHKNYFIGEPQDTFEAIMSGFDVAK